MEPPEAKVIYLDIFEEANGRMVNLVLPCATTGTPPPTVAWFREGMQDPIEASFVGADGRLGINVTIAEAAREGTIYYCVATNRIGPENSTHAALRSRDINVTHSCEF